MMSCTRKSRMDWIGTLLAITMSFAISGCQNASPDSSSPQPPSLTAASGTPAITGTEPAPGSALPPYAGGGQIAFDGGDGIYLLDVALVLESGSDQRQLWIPDGFAAAWSPDASMIAYVTLPDAEHMAISVMNIATGEILQLTETELNAGWPTWSPNGDRIAFLAGPYSNFDIYVMNADGSQQVQLTFSPGMDNQPAWSPDGARIAFASDRQGDVDVYLIDTLTEQAPINLTHSPGVDAAPDWSPDGTQIVFNSDRDEGQENIFIMDADGSQVIQVTDSVYNDWHPAWSPDGSMIAFTSYRSYGGGDAELFVIDLTAGTESEGNAPRQLTFSPIHDDNAVWFPSSPAEPVMTFLFKPLKVSFLNPIERKM
jgi:TolB protein